MFHPLNRAHLPLFINLLLPNAGGNEIPSAELATSPRKPTVADLH